MVCFFSSDFYLFILKSSVSQQYSAANIFLCMHVSWQFLGLWLVSQDWAYCFPKHLWCFSCSFLEPPGKRARLFLLVCGPECLCLGHRAVLARAKETGHLNRSVLYCSLLLPHPLSIPAGAFTVWLLGFFFLLYLRKYIVFYKKAVISCKGMKDFFSFLWWVLATIATFEMLFLPSCLNTNSCN